MIIIADSGATKTDWVVLHENTEKSIKGPGISPVYQLEEAIQQQLLDTFKELEIKKVSHVYFYGSGCVDKNRKSPIKKGLRHVFPQAEIFVESDMLGAARGLCGHKQGVACILGTGSNSCLYDGENIKDNIPALGFILGDEGSGAKIGISLVNAYFKRRFPKDLAINFKEFLQANVGEVIANVYQKPYPSRYLAGISLFALQNFDNAFIYDIVYQNIKSFYERNLSMYPDIEKLEIHFTGSVAWYLKEVICNFLYENGLKTGNFCQSPIQGLVEYHK